MIPASRRSKSKDEFYYKAVEIRDYMTQLMIQDFGSDKEFIKVLNDKGEEEQVINPEYWIIVKFRDKIMNICSTLIDHICYAYTIYINSEETYNLRRKSQTYAIADCQRLLQELQYSIRNISGVKPSKYMEITGYLKEEIKLLKDWRQRDNNVIKKIRENKG